MIDFDSLKNKAEDFVEAHEDQIDQGIDKAANAAGNKFGHSSQIDQAAAKLKDMTPDTKEPHEKAAHHKPLHAKAPEAE